MPFSAIQTDSWIVSNNFLEDRKITHIHLIINTVCEYVSNKKIHVTKNDTCFAFLL